MKALNFDQFLAASSEAIVVDVLPASSFRDGHIPGAINLPLDELAGLASDFIPDSSQYVVVYCGGPRCPLGLQAAEALSELGYGKVSHFEGGIEQWVQRGNELESVKAPEGGLDAPTRHVLEIIDSFSIGQWVFGWIGVVVGCAFVFWGGGELGWRWLWHNGEALPTGLSSLADCLYFSLVTATTLGYGDITPVGWARPLAAAEAMSGMIVVGAIISKLLSSRQEQLVQETHDLTFQERLSRIHTNLHFLIDEFQKAQADCASDTVPVENAHLRFTSAVMLLSGHLSVIRDLLHQRHQATEESALEAVLVTVQATLQSYLNARGAMKPEPNATSRYLATIVDEICAECVPHQYSEVIRQHMDRAHRLAEKIRD